MVKKRAAAPKTEKKPKAKQSKPKGKKAVSVNVNERDEWGDEQQVEQDEQMERPIADQPIHALTEIIDNRITSQVKAKFHGKCSFEEILKSH